ncbi:serine hydrolase domain-containing protein [Agromyces sp. NPDC057865]|uniref:serine hydrolase domain-containing protein n=1 Tax=Agromyces sp. NPDC057865 TaxID=3346267 RepID=UPI00366A57A6
MRQNPATALHRSAILAVMTIGLSAATFGLSACTAAPVSTASPSPTASDDAAATCLGVAPEAVVSAELPATAATGDLDLADELHDAAEQGLALASAPGAIVGVRTPEGTWIEAFGDADPTTGTSATAEDFTRVGSITKTFTSSLILQLVEDGELSLDDTIDQYVDGVQNGDEVTIRMLLNMTSGIPSYTADDAMTTRLFADPTQPWTPEELLSYGLGMPPLSDPGTQFNYSNTNYVLLGTVIEQVTGRPYPEVLQSEILEPLGLEDTYFPDTNGMPDPHLSGFSLQGTPADSQEPVETTNWSPTSAWTAGQVISNIDDMLEWGRVLSTGQGILDEDMAVERLEAIPAEGGYGYGNGCIAGWVGHTGDIEGYNTTVYHHTASDSTIVVLVNSDIPSGDCSDSKTLADNTTGVPCMFPAVRVFAEVSDALGHPFTPLPMS